MAPPKRRSTVDRLARVTHELQARHATVHSISLYVEQLVADLQDKSNRGPNSRLMNFRRFTEQRESFLAQERPGRVTIIFPRTVDIAQWLERRSVAPEVAGSIPVIHPIPPV